LSWTWRRVDEVVPIEGTTRRWSSWSASLTRRRSREGAVRERCGSQLWLTVGSAHRSRASKELRWGLAVRNGEGRGATHKKTARRAHRLLYGVLLVLVALPVPLSRSGMCGVTSRGGGTRRSRRCGGRRARAELGRVCRGAGAQGAVVLPSRCGERRGGEIEMTSLWSAPRMKQLSLSLTSR